MLVFALSILINFYHGTPIMLTTLYPSYASCMAVAEQALPEINSDKHVKGYTAVLPCAAVELPVKA
jgi:hypothetical protein